jgi:pimeloyl-ACP methyl ester carboxylesterase
MMAASAASVLVACGDDNGNGAKTPEPTATVERQAPTATFAESSCGFTLPEGQDASGVRCGTLTVPEDRSKDDGRTLDLAVAVLKATGGSPAADPILYLSGGPGGPSLTGEMQNFDAEFAAPLQVDRDLVFYDQRGTGLSEPGLYCNVFSAFGTGPLRAFALPEITTDVPKAVLRCRDQFRAQGIDLAAYSSAASASDIADLMPLLGYNSWNLYGVSYGTRLAQTVMRDHPQHVRSVVLDSTVPLAVDLETEVARDFERSFDQLLIGCRLNTACNRAYPNLGTDVFDLIARANREPIVVSYTADDGAQVTVPVTGDLILNGTFTAMYSTRLIPIIPFALEQIAHGDIALLTQVVQQLSGAFPGFADGMTLSVNCSDETPFYTERSVIDGTAGVRREILEAGIGLNSTAALRRQLAMCQAWGTKQPKPFENEAVVSGIPTLVLAGEYDPITPPRWGQVARQKLSRSVFFQFPSTGHGVIFGQPSCADRVVTSFLLLNAPIDNSCIAMIPGPNFQVGGSLGAPAPAGG